MILMVKPLYDEASVVLDFDKGGRRSHLQLRAHPQLPQKYYIQLPQKYNTQLSQKYGIITSLALDSWFWPALGRLGDGNMIWARGLVWTSCDDGSSKLSWV